MFEQLKWLIVFYRLSTFSTLKAVGVGGGGGNGSVFAFRCCSLALALLHLFLLPRVILSRPQ